MTRVTNITRLTYKQLDYIKEDREDIIKRDMARGVGNLIAEKFDIYGRKFRDGLEYELSVFVYTEEEIRKIISLSSQGTASSINAMRDILISDRK